jgi:biopolymer transport protein ExbB/TolQ
MTLELSAGDMFMNADPVVRSVMVLLFLASLFSWAVIVEKALVMRRLQKGMREFTSAVSKLENAAVVVDDFPVAARGIVAAGLRESRDFAGDESRADYRERIERAMRCRFGSRMDRAGQRVVFLASVGSTSPFIGLFGTVWGIMHSFAGIAAAGETTLAVIAPGIAEALFATAMGLVAAIPAVLGYNKIIASMKVVSREAMDGIALVANHLAKLHFSLANNRRA